MFNRSVLRSSFGLASGFLFALVAGCSGETGSNPAGVGANLGGSSGSAVGDTSGNLGMGQTGTTTGVADTTGTVATSGTGATTTTSTTSTTTTGASDTAGTTGMAGAASDPSTSASGGAANNGGATGATDSMMNDGTLGQGGAASTMNGNAGMSSVGGADMTGAAGSSAALGGSGGTASDTPLTVSDRSAEGTCERWNADRQERDEGTWSGSVANCDPGDITPEGRTNALRIYNLFRWLADLPPVETSADRNEMAQACALIMEANGRLSHSVDPSWECYTELGAQGASSSNITTGASVRSTDGYMIDRGNETTIGHRRWILSNSLGPIGIGSTGNGASCMQNLNGEGQAGKEWMAWPPPGVFPLEAYGDNFSTLSDTGWTVQSDSIQLSGAQVSVSSGGMSLPVSVTQLQGGYGSRYAFRFNPDGWDVEAGQTYSVEVTGIDTPIAYEVEVVDCGQ